MESLDRDLQARVWQRVQSREKIEMPQLHRDNLKALMLTAQENGAVYQSLSRQMTGKESEKLKRLYQESQRCIACMKGISRLRGEQVKLPQLTAAKEPVRKALEKCYHRERKLWTEWEQRSTDPEHGIVFGRLAGQAKEHCVTIMEVVGSLNEK